MADLQLDPEQIDTLARAMKLGRFIDRSDPGTRKTPPYCVWQWWQWSKNGRRTIWAMPKSILGKNRWEAMRWSEFKESDVVILDGTPKRKQELIESDAKVWLTTFTGFASQWQNIRKIHPDLDCIGVDEWHLGFKGPESQRTGQLFEAMDVLNYLYGMTGTLISGGRLDAAYAAIQLASKTQYYFGIKDFLNQHAIMDPIYETPMAWKNHEKIDTILNEIGKRISFTEKYGPEKKIVIREKCDMSPAQREAYDKFEREALLELEDQFLDGSVPGVATIRCRQIMAHPEKLTLPSEQWLPGDTKPTIVMKEYNLMKKGEVTGKDERLLLHLEEHKANGKPLVIFATLVPEQERIRDLAKSIGLRVGFINGSTSGKQRGDVDASFQTAKLDVVVGSPATMSAGFNWPHVDHIIFASLDYSDDNFLQAYRRAMRGIRKTALRITILEYRKSLDQRILWIVKRKSQDANKVDKTVQILEFDEEEEDDSLSLGSLGKADVEGSKERAIRTPLFHLEE